MGTASTTMSPPCWAVDTPGPSSINPTQTGPPRPRPRTTACQAPWERKTSMLQFRKDLEKLPNPTNLPRSSVPKQTTRVQRLHRQSPPSVMTRVPCPGSWTISTKTWYRKPQNWLSYFRHSITMPISFAGGWDRLGARFTGRWLWRMSTKPMFPTRPTLWQDS